MQQADLITEEGKLETQEETGISQRKDSLADKGQNEMQPEDLTSERQDQKQHWQAFGSLSLVRGLWVLTFGLTHTIHLLLKKNMIFLLYGCQ